MNLQHTKIDDLNYELTINISKEDYAESKKKRLSEHRKKAEIKGFRKGMVPMSLVEKMYGPAVLADSVNDTISKALNEFITENNLKVIGEPLPSDDQPEIEWVDGNDFTFKFDVATTTEVVMDLSEADVVPMYEIEVNDEAKNEMRANMLKQFGNLSDGEVSGAEDFLVVDFKQGEEGVENTYVAIKSVAEGVQASFIGLKADDSIEVNVNEAFTNDTDRAAMLKITKEEVANIEPIYKMTVKNVKTFIPAELNQETYDKIFGEGVVTNEEEFEAKIAERIAYEYSQEAEYKFNKDAKDYLIAKANILLPEAFLKRWLFTINEGKFTMEDIEKEFDSFLVDYRWQMVRTAIIEKYEIKVEESDILESAKAFASYQFSMYGMNNVPDEQLTSYAQTLLSQEKESRRIVEAVYDQKTITSVKEKITAKKEAISIEKFRELK